MIIRVCIIAVVICLLIVLAISQLKNERGKWGERFVKVILWFLPQDYRVFNDVRFNVGRSRCQIDHLVVSKYGIFVIETKSYLGLTIGDSRQSKWRRYVLGKRYSTKSPLIQNDRHVELLIAKYPEISQCLRESLKSIVVFGFGSLIRMRDNSSNVITIFFLYRYIQKFRRQLITEGQLRCICSKFV